MFLVVSNRPNIDLSKQAGVTDVWCSFGDSIVIHLSCEEGNEQQVFENLPQWIHEKMKVTKSHMHVFIKAKK